MNENRTAPKNITLEEAEKIINGNDSIERLLGSIKPYQREAFGCAQWLKAYAESNVAESFMEKTPFETWCVVTIDNMINQVKIDMYDMEAEWDDAIRKGDTSRHDMACYCNQYLIRWFILKNLLELKEEHGNFKHCADMVEPAEVIVMDDGVNE